MDKGSQQIFLWRRHARGQKPIGRCSTVSATRKKQTTTTTALEWVQYKRRRIASVVDENVEKLENSYTAGEIVK